MDLLKVSLPLSMKHCGGETKPQAPASAQLIFLVPFSPLLTHVCTMGEPTLRSLTTCLTFLQRRSSGSLLGV